MIDNLNIFVNHSLATDLSQVVLSGSLVQNPYTPTLLRYLGGKNIYIDEASGDKGPRTGHFGVSNHSLICLYILLPFFCSVYMHLIVIRLHCEFRRLSNGIGIERGNAVAG